jgi:hypothetical protein
LKRWMTTGTATAASAQRNPGYAKIIADKNTQLSRGWQHNRILHFTFVSQARGPVAPQAFILYIWFNSSFHMSSAVASLGKNLTLLALVLFTGFNYFFGWLNWKELFAVQCLAGTGYVFLSCYEYLNASYKASLPVQRYPYITNYFLMWAMLKIAIFSGFSALLYLSSSPVRVLYPICVIIATTEAVILYMKYKNDLCFVNIYANYLLIVQGAFTRLFASEIMIVEFRHDIFYFVKKNRKTITVRLEHISEKEGFILSLNDWIIRNHVLVSEESKEKINELIA